MFKASNYKQILFIRPCKLAIWPIVYLLLIQYQTDSFYSPHEICDVLQGFICDVVAHEQEDGFLICVRRSTPQALITQSLSVLHRQQPILLETEIKKSNGVKY